MNTDKNGSERLAAMTLIDVPLFLGSFLSAFIRVNLWLKIRRLIVAEG